MGSPVAEIKKAAKTRDRALEKLKSASERLRLECTEGARVRGYVDHNGNLKFEVCGSNYQADGVEINTDDLEEIYHWLAGIFGAETKKKAPKKRKQKGNA